MNYLYIFAEIKDLTPYEKKKKRILLPHLHLSSLKIPHNMINTGCVEVIHYEKYAEMVGEKSFSPIFEKVGYENNWLVILDNPGKAPRWPHCPGRSVTPCLHCHKFDNHEDKTKIFKLDLTMLQKENKKPPLFYTDSKKSNEKSIKQWIKGPRNRDLISDPFHVEGFEAENVIVFQNYPPEERVGFSVLSRATSKLVVIVTTPDADCVERDSKKPKLQI